MWLVLNSIIIYLDWLLQSLWLPVEIWNDYVIYRTSRHINLLYLWNCRYKSGSARQIGFCESTHRTTCFILYALPHNSIACAFDVIVSCCGKISNIYSCQPLETDTSQQKKKKTTKFLVRVICMVKFLFTWRA